MADSLAQIREQLIALLPRLRRFARTLTQHREDADDLVQVALEKAITRYEQWDVNSRLDSWMFTIIRNAWIDEVRVRQRHGTHLDLDAVIEHADDAQCDHRVEITTGVGTLARGTAYRSESGAGRRTFV
jgi:RNA polymerase sigma-70 factor, ECF subfamily